jgi:hypothetical protein
VLKLLSTTPSRRRGSDLGTSWSWGVSFTHLPFYPPPPGERAPGTHWIGGWVDPQSQSGRYREVKILGLTGTWNCDPSVVEHVGSRYTDCASGAHVKTKPIHNGIMGDISNNGRLYFTTRHLNLQLSQLSVVDLIEYVVTWFLWGTNWISLSFCSVKSCTSIIVILLRATALVKVLCASGLGKYFLRVF